MVMVVAIVGSCLSPWTRGFWRTPLFQRWGGSGLASSADPGGCQQDVREMESWSAARTPRIKLKRLARVDKGINDASYHHARLSMLLPLLGSVWCTGTCRLEHKWRQLFTPDADAALLRGCFFDIVRILSGSPTLCMMGVGVSWESVGPAVPRAPDSFGKQGARSSTYTVYFLPAARNGTLTFV